MADDLRQMVLNRTWRPQLAVSAWTAIRAEVPACAAALLDVSSAAFPALDGSVRTGGQAGAGGRSALRRRGRLAARRNDRMARAAAGAWLEAVARASGAFGRPAAHMGEGGSIPFMGMLGEKFPATVHHRRGSALCAWLTIPAHSTGKRVTSAVAPDRRHHERPRRSAPHLPRRAALVTPTPAGKLTRENREPRMQLRSLRLVAASLRTARGSVRCGR